MNVGDRVRVIDYGLDSNSNVTQAQLNAIVGRVGRVLEVDLYVTVEFDPPVLWPARGRVRYLPQVHLLPAELEVL